MIQKKIKLLVLVLFIMGSFFVFRNIVSAQGSPDAISVRVVPNPNHYSAQRWYNEQGFIGTPQQLIVDGYEAIRNGNTVYVNAANVSVSPSPSLFTNIYIISYNLSADKETEDIFARILDHWKFNRNIGMITGFCSPDFSSTICFTSDDCSLGEYCSSDKAEVIRDTKRLADIAEFNIALDEYMKKNGHYPILSSGTYLPNKTVSTWPSWQGTLSKDLGIQLPSDPVNDLGSCVGYDDVTCWDENNKTFADPIPNSILDLPVGSRAFIYQVDPDGSSFDICSEMESGFISGASSGACANGTATAPPTNPASPVTSPSAPVSVIPQNYPPQIILSNIPTAVSGNYYTAYIQAVDPNNDMITWSIDTSMTTWTGWSSPPSIVFTAVNNKISIEATSAGNTGTYPFKIIVTDSLGASTEQTFTINIQQLPPTINSIPLFHKASSTLSFSGAVSANSNISDPTLTYSLDQPFPFSFTNTFTPSGSSYNLDISGILVPGIPGNTMNDGITPIVRSLTVTDSFGTTKTEQVVINVTNHKPAITPLPTCQDRIRSLPAVFTPPSSVLGPIINSITISPNPWVVNNIDTGGVTSVNITVSTSNTSGGACTWCGSPVSCNGTTLIQSSGLETGSIISCLLRATNNGQTVTRRAYSKYDCIGLHQSQGTFMGWGSGGCNTGADISQCVVAGNCSASYVNDGPACVASSYSPTGFYDQTCFGTCSVPGAYCDAYAQDWGLSCPGVWTVDNSTRTAVDCCSDGDCSSSHTCLGGKCVYEALYPSALPLSLDCLSTATSSTWFQTYGQRCIDPDNLSFWNTQIANGSTTADFITAYDNECMANSGTTNRAICNNNLLCGGGTYITNTNDCNE